MAHRPALIITPSTLLISVAGASVPTNGTFDFVFGAIRTTTNTQTMLFSVPMIAGDTVTIQGTIQAFVANTHANHAGWRSVAAGKRTSAGVSSRTSSAGGGGSGQYANDFGGPKPTLGVSDPNSAVSPNVLHSIGFLVTGQSGVEIIWEYALRIMRGKNV